MNAHDAKPKQLTRLLRIGVIFFVALMTVAIAGCRGSEVTAPIVGPIWEWTGTTDTAGNTTPVPNPALYTIQFQANNTYQGRADCNTISGSYKVDGYSLQINSGTTSLVACPAGSLATQFTTQLFAVSSFAMQGTELTLNLQANAGAMHFRQAGAPSNASVLIGPLWKWRQTQFNNNTNQFPADPNQYTIQFSANGQVEVKADCNQGSGVYTTGANNALTIQIKQMTRAACPAGSLSDEYIRQLESTSSFFTGGPDLVLNVQRDTGRMIFEAGAAPTAAPTGVIVTTTPLPSPVPPTSVPVTVPPACPGTPQIQFFQAEPPTIVRGQNTVLRWGAVTNATAVAIDQGIGGVATPGSIIVAPATTTTYIMTATGCGGTAQAVVTVTVVQPTAPPPTQAPTQPPPTKVPPTQPPPTEVPPTQPPTPTPIPGADIIGINWKWTSVVLNDGTRLTPSDPNQYTVNFQANGQVAVKADCNNASGTYVISGNSLTIQLPVITGALCSPESLSQQFVQLLQQAGRYSTQANTLTIELKADSGSMTFVK